MVIGGNGCVPSKILKQENQVAVTRAIVVSDSVVSTLIFL